MKSCERPFRLNAFKVVILSAVRCTCVHAGSVRFKPDICLKNDSSSPRPIAAAIGGTANSSREEHAALVLGRMKKARRVIAATISVLPPTASYQKIKGRRLSVPNIAEKRLSASSQRKPALLRALLHFVRYCNAPHCCSSCSSARTHTTKASHDQTTREFRFLAHEPRGAKQL